MADDTRAWALIHAERARLADLIASFNSEQWNTPSLCEGWTVGQLSGHVLAGAEQTPGNFMSGMVKSGFRFDAMMKKDVESRVNQGQQEIVDRLRQRTTTTNKPPAPAMAMLGEAVVHGEDLRRPLGMTADVDPDAVNACLDMYTKANFPVGGKKRIAGLRLVANDTGWSYGSGPEVNGTGLAVMLAMTGRSVALDELNGDGAGTLRSRVASGGTAVG